MKRLALVTVFVAVLAFALCFFTHGEEIKPVLPPGSINFKIEFTELADVPPDIAKTFPPQAYYWWALAHNAKVSSHSTPTSYPVTTEEIRGSAPGTYTYGGYGYGGRYTRPGIYGQKTIHRTFNEQVGSGPVTLYNPYFRADK